MNRFILISRVRFLLVVILVGFLQACVTTDNSQFSHKNDVKASRYNAQLGINYLNKNRDLEYARIKLERALSQDKDNALAHAGYAQLQTLVGNKDKAEVHYRQAINLEPLNANHQNAYGVFLCERGEVSESLTAFDKAASNRYYKTPEHALDNAGVCLLDAGKTKQAEIYLVNAIKRNPKYAPSLLNSADLNLRTEKIELANAFYLRYKKLGRESARSLWIGYQIKHAMGLNQEAKAISDTMLARYPNSKHTGDLLLMTVNDQ